MTDSSFDFDLIVIGAGYGGFDAAKHAAGKGLKVAIVESSDMGGTCVNKGCVPSKALLAASGKVREIANYEHLAKFGIHASPVRFERSKIADHANNLVLNVRENLTKTLKRSGVEIILGIGRIEGNQKVGVRDKNGIDKIFTCKNVVIATGSSPFVPRGITVDNICGGNVEINYKSIPAATFTHPEISSVGLSEVEAKEISTKENFTLGVVKSFFKANSKALAELESDGLLKLIFNKDNGKVLGAHIFGLHAADLIQEISNAISRNQDVIELSKEVHTHPTLSEVVEVAYKQAASQIK